MFSRHQRASSLHSRLSGAIVALTLAVPVVALSAAPAEAHGTQGKANYSDRVNGNAGAPNSRDGGMADPPGPPAPDVSTKVNNTTISTTGTVSDRATLTGGNGPVTGHVDFRLCVGTTSGCSQTGTVIEVRLVPLQKGTATGTFGPGLAPGNYCIGLNYRNDGRSRYSDTYSGSKIGECFTVGSVPSITTKLSAPMITAGGVANDTAKLTGATTDAGGTVDYRYYSDPTACVADTAAWPSPATGGTSAGTVTVNGSVPNSPTVTFNVAPRYYWAAFYSGDAKNAPAVSACTTEVLIVNPTKPSIGTSLSPNPVLVGDMVHDSATLTGATSIAGGTVDYRYYSDLASCEADTVAWPSPPTGGTSAGTVTVNGSVPNSPDVTFPVEGTYYWAAFYTGDPSNRSAASDCTTETLPVDKRKPAIDTKLSRPWVIAGRPVQDTARLTGSSSNAGGTVYYRYYTSLGACWADAATWTGTEPLHGYSAGAVTVMNGNVPASSIVRIGRPGKYYWAAFYTGDINNEPAASKCSREVLWVKPKPVKKPCVITKLSKHHVQVGWPVRDTAVVVGGGGYASGYLQYRYYPRLSDCQKDTYLWPYRSPMRGYSAGTVRVYGGYAGPSSTVWFNRPGVYYWAAFYYGDARNAPAASDCRSEVLWVTPCSNERLQNQHVAPATQAGEATLQRRVHPAGSPLVPQDAVQSAPDLILDSAVQRLGQRPARSGQLPGGGHQAV